MTPQLTGISPASWNVGSAVAETLTGQGLTGATVTVGTGTTITASGTTVNSAGTSISTNFNIPSSASAGTYAVSVSVPNSDGGTLTSNSVNFTALRCGVPTNFQQQSCSDIGSGDLHFVYTWVSSTGSLADLQGCTVGEIVTYPGTQNPGPSRARRSLRMPTATRPSVMSRPHRERSPTITFSHRARRL